MWPVKTLMIINKLIPHTVLCWFQWASQSIFEVDNNGSIILSIQIRKLGLREIKWLAKIHTTAGIKLRVEHLGISLHLLTHTHIFPGTQMNMCAWINDDVNCMLSKVASYKSETRLTAILSAISYFLSYC